jgi:hypothetical protein
MSTSYLSTRRPCSTLLVRKYLQTFGRQLHVHLPAEIKLCRNFPAQCLPFSRFSSKPWCNVLTSTALARLLRAYVISKCNNLRIHKSVVPPLNSSSLKSTTTKLLLIFTSFALFGGTTFRRHRKPLFGPQAMSSCAKVTPSSPPVLQVLHSEAGSPA